MMQVISSYGSAYNCYAATPIIGRKSNSGCKSGIGGAISQAMHLGHFGVAFSWLFGRYYRRQLLTFRGVLRGLYVVELACEAFLRNRLGGGWYTRESRA